LVKEGVQNEIAIPNALKLSRSKTADAERELRSLRTVYARHLTWRVKTRCKDHPCRRKRRSSRQDDTALLEYVTLKVGSIDEIVLVVTKQVRRRSVLSTHIPAHQRAHPSY